MHYLRTVLSYVICSKLELRMKLKKKNLFLTTVFRNNTLWHKLDCDYFLKRILYYSVVWNILIQFDCSRSVFPSWGHLPSGCEWDELDGTLNFRTLCFLFSASSIFKQSVILVFGVFLEHWNVEEVFMPWDCCLPGVVLLWECNLSFIALCVYFAFYWGMLAAQ